MVEDERNAILEELEAIGRRRKRWLIWIRIWTCLAALAVFIIAQIESLRPAGEPFYWFEGVSVWPTEIMRVGIIGLCMGLLVRMWHKHQVHRILLRYEFFGESLMLKKGWFQRVVLERENRARNKGPIHWWLMGARWIGGIWKHRLNRKKKISVRRARHKVNANQLFHHYLRRAILPSRAARFIPMAACYFAISFFCTWYFGMPRSPLRAPLPYVKALDFGILVTCIGAWMLVAFYVLDAVRLSRALISGLADGRTQWPNRVLNSLAERLNMDPEHLSGYLDVRLTATHTKEVYQLVFYPMFVLLLMIVARMNICERWTWPPALLTIFGASAVILLGCAIQLRRSAASVREAALAEMAELQVRFAEGKHGRTYVDIAKGVGGTLAAKWEDYDRSLKSIYDEIRAIRTGAFAPWPSDLAVVAALIPTGGAGLIALIQKLLE